VIIWHWNQVKKGFIESKWVFNDPDKKPVTLEILQGKLSRKEAGEGEGRG